jgi:hypothetical protein
VSCPIDANGATDDGLKVVIPDAGALALGKGDHQVGIVVDRGAPRTSAPYPARITIT